MSRYQLGERWQGWAILCGAGLIAMMVLGNIMWRAVEPAPVQFKGQMIENSFVRQGDVMRVQAEVRRLEWKGCTNGVQAEAQPDAGEVVRLPVPTRVIEGSISRYSIDMVAIDPGRYRLLLRELTMCGGSPKIAESNWTVFEVVK